LETGGAPAENGGAAARGAGSTYVVLTLPRSDTWTSCIPSPCWIASRLLAAPTRPADLSAMALANAEAFAKVEGSTEAHTDGGVAYQFP
jgi:hypothetical protein